MSWLEDVSIAAFSFIDSRFSTFYQIIHQFVTQVEYWYLKVTCWCLDANFLDKINSSITLHFPLIRWFRQCDGLLSKTSLAL